VYHLDAGHADGALRFAVLVSRAGSKESQTLVVEAPAPLAAAMEAFARCVGTWPEVIDVHPIGAVADGEPSLHVRFVASDGERIRIRVQGIRGPKDVHSGSGAAFRGRSSIRLTEGLWSAAS